jgi:hypothetical protein
MVRESNHMNFVQFCAMAQAVSRRPIIAYPGVQPRPFHIGFVMDNGKDAQIFQKYRSHLKILGTKKVTEQFPH